MGSFTVFFDGQFWVGLAVRHRDSNSRVPEVARVVFGPEPSDAELLEWTREQFQRLEYRAVDSTAPLERASAGNPKRRQREARRALEETTTRTRAQTALAAALEEERGKQERERRARRQEQADERFRCRAEKRKRARRGK
ncbi:hypothetical protein AKJ09_02388 [Labilithrix luteola]|uniref:DUF2992 family protein n=1 Tax=Labilithrix luteola TaxID=1391654 RepID=A0A0K1PRJ4_9BACT|nr:DUF2992 family protein [Labilithrix luteola]AKU95724.1 hypothetical protein AKJ09_02388 [Labilithrix luteola]